VNVVLKPLELLWRGINRVRRALYRRGVLHATKLGKPVISVGNIAAGGAGKTPCVIAIARALTARGLRVAVLTRGYGRAGGWGVVDSLDAARFGDEPVLIKKSVPNADVIVGSNRIRQSFLSNADVYLLDDGFQHLQLARDVDVVIDVPDARWHREGLSALRDADFVIQRRLRLSIPPVSRAFAFAGLADNDQFFAALRSGGVALTGTRSFPDHHRYTAADLDAIRRAANSETILTTEKDAVKIDDAGIVAVPAEFEIDPAVLDAIVARIRP